MVVELKGDFRFKNNNKYRYGFGPGQPHKFGIQIHELCIRDADPFVVPILETTVQCSICSDGWLPDWESGREYPEAA